ncbi:MAG: hypothetical protein JWP99_224 [Devosia sp.]|nr:hypothetical protein [Devosia sp.]
MLASISTLGNCSVAIADQHLPGAPSNLFRLASFVTLSGHKLSASRQRLGALLWPDVSHAKAAANLRQALLRIRHFQMDHAFAFLDSNVSGVFIENPHAVDFDLLALLDRLADPAPRAAVDLCTIYGGELLADLPDSGSEFEEWLALQRDHLRDRCTARLTAAIATTNDLSEEDRMTCAQKLLQLDPCNEDAYCCLMLQAAAHGHRSRLHTLFDNCQRHLMRELGVRPSAHTVQVFRELVQRLNMLVI